MMSRKLGLGVLAGALLWLSGCASSGPVDNPVGSVLTWFSYVGGEDIRDACHPGAPEMWRFVYNGDYQEQVRAYDLTVLHSGGARLQIRVTGPRNILAVNALNPFQPWEAKRQDVWLSPAQMAALRDALHRSGFDNPAPRGTFLRSDGYYWAVSACQGGRFHFNAWTAPDQPVAALPFVPVLLSHDHSTLAYNLPAHVVLGPFGGGGDPTQPKKQFRLQVGTNGLILGPTFR